LVVNAQQITDFSIKNTSFAVPPQPVLSAQNVPDGGLLTPSTILLPGAVSGTNVLLSTYIQDGKFTFFRQILDVFTGQVLQSFNPIETSLSPNGGVRVTATSDGWLAFGDVEFDDNRFSQIYIYKMLLNGTQIERVAATLNNDGNTVYRLDALFNDNINFIIGYEIGSSPNGASFTGSKFVLNKLNILDDSLGVEFPVTNGDVDSVSCDSLPYSSTAYCIFKQNQNSRGAIISVTNTFSQSPANILTDSGNTIYNPVYLAGVNGYYVALFTAKQGDQISLIGRIVATTLGPTVINKWVLSNDLVSISVNSVLPYYDGFMVFYGVTDAANNQYWYYEAFTKDFNVMLSPTLIATVPSNYLLSSFSVAQSSTGGTPSDSYIDNHYKPINTANGNPLGLLAIQATASQTIDAWYGQIVNQTVDSSYFQQSNAGATISTPLVLIVSFILGLLLLF
jgi:hypothetical protein